MRLGLVLFKNVFAMSQSKGTKNWDNQICLSNAKEGGRFRFRPRLPRASSVQGPPQSHPSSHLAPAPTLLFTTHAIELTAD